MWLWRFLICINFKITKQFFSEPISLKFSRSSVRSPYPLWLRSLSGFLSHLPFSSLWSWKLSYSFFDFLNLFLISWLNFCGGRICIQNIKYVRSVYFDVSSKNEDSCVVTILYIYRKKPGTTEGPPRPSPLLNNDY